MIWDGATGSGMNWRLALSELEAERGHLRLDGEPVILYSLLSPPGQTRANLLQELYCLDAVMTVSLEWRPWAVEAARRRIRGAQRHYFARRYSMMAHVQETEGTAAAMVDSAAATESDRLGEALVELEADGVSYGEATLTVALHGELGSIERLDGDLRRLFAAHDAKVLDTHHERARRLVHALIAQGAAAEETVPGVRGIGRVCRIFSRGLYRALGAEHIRHRRTASADVLMRRLLSLDYVIEHSGLPWLPTEPEKVAAFEALGIERELLPSRLYRGAAGDTRRYFPFKLPVALEAERALFVYVDPGHDTATALRSWGAAHRGLWLALHRLGRSVEVVAVARTSREMDRALAVMSGWAEASGPGERDAGIREELARIERAILQGAVQILEEFGGLQAALKRSVALERQGRRQAGRGAIHRGVAWQTVRLAGARYR